MGDSCAVRAKEKRLSQLIKRRHKEETGGDRRRQVRRHAEETGGDR